MHAIRETGKSEISFMSARNIKYNLKKGNIIYKNIIDMLPFYDEVIVKEVKGEDIINALEYSVRFLPDKSAKFLQVSGISFKIDSTIISTVEVDENDIFVKVKGNRRVYDIKIGEKDIDSNKKYKISFDNIGAGGDGYSMFREYKEILNTHISKKDALLNYIKNNLNGTIPDRYKNTEERIVIKPKDKDNSFTSLIIITAIIIVVIVLIISIWGNSYFYI